MVQRKQIIFVCDRCGHEKEDAQPAAIVTVSVPGLNKTASRRTELCGSCDTDLSIFLLNVTEEAPHELP